MVIFWVLWMICSASALSGQEKKALDERAYEEWLYLQSECISPDGRWVAYEQRNKMGCRRIVIHGESATDTINFFTERTDFLLNQMNQYLRITAALKDTSLILHLHF